MKKTLILGVALAFATVGYSQTAEKSHSEKPACCAKGKAACCEKGSKKSKSCADSKSTAKHDHSEMAPITATKPEQQEGGEKKKTSDL